MAQSWWLSQRALRLQNACFAPEGIDEKRLALFLRYQTTHERAFHKALNTLIRLQRAHRAFGARCARYDMDRRREMAAHAVDEPAFLSEAKTQANGFVSQNSAQPDESASETALESLEEELPASQAA
jgi:hypothetical protein